MDGIQCARIIGGEGDIGKKQYGFYRDGRRLAVPDLLLFYNDLDAVAWFEEHYPAEFARGAEMRVYD